MIYGRSSRGERRQFLGCVLSIKGLPKVARDIAASRWPGMWVSLKP